MIAAIGTILGKRNEYQKQWYQRNKDNVKARVRAREQSLRAELLEALGNKCSCCGESTKHFLAVDHINGVSDEERELAAQYKRGLKTGRRPRLSGDLLYIFALARLDQFQVLCHNCNLGRELNGGACPHKG